MKTIINKNLLIVLTFVNIITPAIAEARDNCLTIKDVLESNKPAGTFANTAWSVYEAKDSYADWSGSELVFSEEKIRESKVSLKGYFYWLADGESFGCEKVSGVFNKKTSVLRIKTIGVSTYELSDSTFYKAKLSPDGEIFSGSWNGQNTTNGKWKARRVNLSEN